MIDKRINVTQPSLPPLDEFISYLEKIWDSKQLTNNGQFHQQFEKELADFLGVKYICLVANGTLALMLALKALDIKGEVITTPFSFVATAHSILWNNSEPVFCDIEEKTLNIDPDKIEQLITEKTTAIMPVHVYGHPCDNNKIQAITKKHNLKVIYDAAHAFHVKQNDNSILNWGDLSILSFHATKIFNTFEGGSIICHDAKTKRIIDDLKNFGFRSETEVEVSGINAKMNELQAAMGLLQLRYVEENIDKRKKISQYYRNVLKNIEGIKCFQDLPEVTANYSYFPILIDKQKYGKSRDEVYKLLKQNNIFTRRYFYPLISKFEPYNKLDSASSEQLLVAEKIAKQILCLPLYPNLSYETIKVIIKILFNN
ncbi:MAG: DegT/DnrJ/EryC1/StrS family aminotransferase [Bacteroidales bacterium]|nr:DegT/DnrJ/EryC1/StrS family aminotransferase [Bacteroidales bacterium]